MSHRAVEQIDESSIDLIFHALSDETRRDIVRRALGGEYSVSSLAESYSMSFAAVQKHVAVLEEAGLVIKRQHGRERLVSTNVSTLQLAAQLLDELEQIWRDRMQRFDQLLEQPKPKNH